MSVRLRGTGHDAVVQHDERHPAGSPLRVGALKDEAQRLLHICRWQIEQVSIVVSGQHHHFVRGGLGCQRPCIADGYRNPASMGVEAGSLRASPARDCAIAGGTEGAVPRGRRQLETDGAPQRALWRAPGGGDDAQVAAERI